MNEDKRKGEPQYEEVIKQMRLKGPAKLGLMTSWAWYDDPRRLAFTLARYKFVSKMFDGFNEVLEVGCGDGFGARVVAQAVKSLTAVDFDPEFVQSAKEVASDIYNINFEVHDMLQGPVCGSFNGIYSMDVLEHIELSQEDMFLKNMLLPLKEDGVCIVGMPSLESQVYASKFSKMGHVNCKDQPSLKALMGLYFRNVFIFSMNDEIVHTGYGKMSHYNIALCCYKR